MKRQIKSEFQILLLKSYIRKHKVINMFMINGKKCIISAW